MSRTYLLETHTEALRSPGRPRPALLTLDVRSRAVWPRNVAVIAFFKRVTSRTIFFSKRAGDTGALDMAENDDWWRRAAELP